MNLRKDRDEAQRVFYKQPLDSALRSEIILNPDPDQAEQKLNGGAEAC